MTEEGVFPKSAGDIAYASEANNFAGGGRIAWTGTTDWFASGAGTTVAGSILLSAPPIPLMIDGAFRTDGTFARPRIQFSGGGLNTTIRTKSTAEASHSFHSLIGSKIGLMQIYSQDMAGDEGSNPIQTTQGLGAFNTGSDLVIFMNFTDYAGAGSAFAEFVFKGEGNYGGAIF